MVSCWGWVWWYLLLNGFKDLFFFKMLFHVNLAIFQNILVHLKPIHQLFLVIYYIINCVFPKKFQNFLMRKHFFLKFKFWNSNKNPIKGEALDCIGLFLIEFRDYMNSLPKHLSGALFWKDHFLFLEFFLKQSHVSGVILHCISQKTSLTFSQVNRIFDDSVVVLALNRL